MSSKLPSKNQHQQVRPDSKEKLPMRPLDIILLVDAESILSNLQGGSLNKPRELDETCGHLMLIAPKLDLNPSMDFTATGFGTSSIHIQGGRGNRNSLIRFHTKVLQPVEYTVLMMGCNLIADKQNQSSRNKAILKIKNRSGMVMKPGRNPQDNLQNEKREMLWWEVKVMNDTSIFRFRLLLNIWGNSQEMSDLGYFAWSGEIETPLPKKSPEHRRKPQ